MQFVKGKPPETQYATRPGARAKRREVALGRPGFEPGRIARMAEFKAIPRPGEGLECTTRLLSQTGRPLRTLASRRPCMRVLEELQLHALMSEAQPSSSSCVQLGSGTCKRGMQGLSEVRG
jgi:hypothetical protein